MSSVQVDSSFRFGFLYPIVKKTVTAIKWLNISEWFKFFAAKIGKACLKDPSEGEIKQLKNFGIDFYQLLKWGVIVTLIWSGTYNQFWHWLVVYLLCSNLFSYFYYHVWEGGNSGMDLDRQRRRFVKLLSAIAFVVFCYAYLYEFAFPTEIKWPNGETDFGNAIYLSIANAFTFDGFEPTSKKVRLVFASQLVITFFFFSIILSESVPERK